MLVSCLLMTSVCYWLMCVLAVAPTQYEGGGNTLADYNAAWRHIIDVFTYQGVPPHGLVKWQVNIVSNSNCITVPNTHCIP